MKVKPITTLATVGVAVALAAAADPSRPLIIGHRGAAGYRPEHTLAGYRLAAEMGADYIEPDLVATRDGVLIARHENEIGATTDVADRFPERRRTKRIDGQEVTGWFSEDFTLAEIKTLRARERLPFRSHQFDGQFEVPTFGEILELAQQLGRELGHPVGVYPETKHPTYFRSISLPLEDPLLKALATHGWDSRAAPVFIQSFETANLRALRKQTSIRLIQLIDGTNGPWDRHDEPTFHSVSDLTSDRGLQEIASYADGIGPDRRLVVPATADGQLLAPTDLVGRAHAAGLVVHIWTLRSEPMFLSPFYNGRPEAEYLQFRDLGVDGMFTDFADVARLALGPPRPR